MLLVLTFLNNGGNYNLVIILVECHEDAFIFKWSKYLPDMCMVTKVALVINMLNFDG